MPPDLFLSECEEFYKVILIYIIKSQIKHFLCFNMILLVPFTKMLCVFRCFTEEKGKYPLISAFSSWNLISFLVHAPIQCCAFVNVFLHICSSRDIYPFYQANIYFNMILSASFSGENWLHRHKHTYKIWLYFLHMDNHIQILFYNTD